MPIKVSSLNDLVANVTDVEVSAEWYQRVLGMQRKDLDPAHGKQNRISLLFGNQKINLRPVSADKEEWVTADHEEAGSEDLCFLTDTTPKEVIDHLKNCGVIGCGRAKAIAPAPTTMTTAIAIIPDRRQMDLIG
jgi:glyoxalase/bleomycin resistance protein/dioxygenase superfamily protein